MSKQSRELGRAEKAAAIRAAQERKERNRRLGLIAAIVVVLGAIVAGGAWYTSGSSGDPVSDASSVAAAVDGGVTVGPNDAPVKVVVYEDFQCPYCRQLEDQTRDFLRENAAAGKVQVEYHPIPLLGDLPYSSRGLNAFAAVLKHASPKAALKLHDLLYDHQPYETASGSVTNEDIAKLVDEAGGSNDAVTAALASKDQDFFDVALALMQSKQINGTPTVFINGKEITGSVDQQVSQIEDAVTNG